METPSNANLTQLVTMQPNLSGFKNQTLAPFPNFFENPNVSSSNLYENKKRKSTLPPLPPSRAHSKLRSLLLRSVPRSLVFENELKHELAHGRGKDNADLDMGKLRRTVSNRLCAQASRLRGTQYALDLEKEVAKIQDTIAILAPQLESEMENNKLLLLENNWLQKEVERITNEDKIRQMRREALEFEIQRLKELQNAAKGYVQDLNPEPQPVLNLNLTTQLPYSTLSFYQERLQTLQINSALKEVLSDEVISSFLADQEPVEPDLEPNQPMEEATEGHLTYEDVNLDEIIFV